jgi:RNA polymerase sigma-70 factor (ECF subfamily)
VNTDSADLLAVQRALRGDDTGFRELVERYTGLLFALSWRMLGDREDAADAVQEIFLRVYRALPRFRLGARFHTWLYTIALNWLRSRLRSRRSRRAAEARLRPPESGPDPADVALDREAERLAASALARLPARYREPFVLRHSQELSIREIAEVLGLPEGTVKVRLHRARRLLAAALEGGNGGAGIDAAKPPGPTGV